MESMCTSIDSDRSLDEQSANATRNRHKPTRFRHPACHNPPGKRTIAGMPSQAVAAIIPALISRYANGESLNTLAAENSVNRTTIYRWILAGVGDEHHQDLVTQCLVNRVADADQQLESASDACNVTRAREIARFARMDYERRRPHLYGQKHEITQTVTVTIEQTLSADARALLRHVRGRVIEHADTQNVVADDPVHPQQQAPILSITKDDSVK